MTRFNGIVAATVSQFNSGKADKNGLMPVILIPVAGRIPNRNVLSGTVADNMGVEIGSTYLFKITEVEPDKEYGRRFTYTPLSKLGVLEILEAQQKLGDGIIFSVDTEDNSEPKVAEISEFEAANK